MASSVWGGPLAGWIGGGEVGSIRPSASEMALEEGDRRVILAEASALHDFREATAARVAAAGGEE